MRSKRVKNDVSMKFNVLKLVMRIRNYEQDMVFLYSVPKGGGN